MSLGKADLAATTLTTVYTVTTGKIGTCNVSICNRNATAVTVRLAIAATATPTNSEWLEYDAAIPANSTLERSGVVLQSTEKVVAYSNSANVTVQVYGFED